MATFDEIATQYANEIRVAAQQSRLKTASLSEQVIRDDPLTVTVRDLSERIDSLRYSGKDRPLTEEDRKDLLGRVGEALNLQDPQLVGEMLKESSNRNFLALAKLTSMLLAQLGRK